MPSVNRGLGKGLGKGLDSMIPDKHVAGKKEDNVSRETLMMDINKIEPNRKQPRQKFNDDTLNELADSIKQMGVIQPLIIRKKGKMYEIIAGERRWRASKIAGIKQVPVIIKDYTEKEFCMTVNMLYSDYKDVLGEDVSKYVKMAKAFLEDEDSKFYGGEKLSMYYFIFADDDEKSGR